MDCKHCQNIFEIGQLPKFLTKSNTLEILKPPDRPYQSQLGVRVSAQIAATVNFHGFNDPN